VKYQYHESNRNLDELHSQQRAALRVLVLLTRVHHSHRKNQRQIHHFCHGSRIGRVRSSSVVQRHIPFCSNPSAYNQIKPGVVVVAHRRLVQSGESFLNLPVLPFEGRVFTKVDMGAKPQGTLENLVSVSLADCVCAS
jgi:hypothetical protein